MKLSLWNLIISLRADIGTLLERTLFLPDAKSDSEQAPGQLVQEDTLTRLRAELRTKLDTLKDNLIRELTENEIYLVMFPLVLLCDEMVMTRLPKQQQTHWFLLQSELFQINYGGDVFYDFVDERLAKPDTPAIVFEVMYYCLGAGFVGKFGADDSKVQRYKSLLCERIPGAYNPLRKRRRRREPKPDPNAAPPGVMRSPDAQSAARPRSAIWYYLVTLGILFIAMGGMLAVSNL
jgi:type VI secretion system protein ImpK